LPCSQADLRSGPANAPISDSIPSEGRCNRYPHSRDNPIASGELNPDATRQDSIGAFVAGTKKLDTPGATYRRPTPVAFFEQRTNQLDPSCEAKAVADQAAADDPYQAPLVINHRPTAVARIHRRGDLKSRCSDCRDDPLGARPAERPSKEPGGL
jgi:hypothetical protein